MRWSSDVRVQDIFVCIRTECRNTYAEFLKAFVSVLPRLIQQWNSPMLSYDSANYHQVKYHQFEMPTFLHSRHTGKPFFHQR